MSNRASNVLACLLETSTFSDFTMVCGDREFKLHKNIVCLQSKMIQRALEGEFQEARTGIMKVEEFHPQIIKYMVDFLYKGDYEVNPAELASISLFDDERLSADTTIPYRGDVPRVEDISGIGMPLDGEGYLRTVLCHIHINAAGDYYGIPALQELSITKIQAIFDKDWRFWVYPTIIKATLQKAGDTRLHDLLASTATDHLGDLVRDPVFNALDWQKEFTARILKCCSKKIEIDGRGKVLLEDDAQNKPRRELWRPMRCERCSDSVYVTITTDKEKDALDFVCNLCRGPFE